MIILRQNEFSSKKKSTKNNNDTTAETLAARAGAGTALLATSNKIGETKKAINSAILTHMDAKGMPTDQIRSDIEHGRAQFKGDIQ